VTPIHVPRNTPGPPIPVGNSPVAIVVTPNGKTAYVSNQNDDTVTPIRTATNSALPPIHVGHQPFDMAVTPNGRTLYVLNSGGDTVTPILVATNTTGAPIPTASAVHPRRHSGRQNALRDRRRQPAHPDPYLEQPSGHAYHRRGWAQRYRLRYSSALGDQRSPYA
jgi:YVTN family beta-propeller protein